jgi:ribosomal protein S18 acetylase RimI-like enzyme
MFSVKSASKPDIPLIRKLTYKVWPQTYAAIISPEQIDYMLEMMYSETSLQQQMDSGCCFVIVYDDKEPAGFASFQHIGEGVYKLHKIYVLPSQQGKGTGKFLLQYIMEEIKKEKALSLQLQVNRHNKAKDFYEKLGFTVMEEADFEIGNGYYMNDYVMEKKL